MIKSVFSKEKAIAISPLCAGQRGFQEAEVHDSRKMSTLILRTAREHHMGKYTLVASNQLGTAESNCDLIVRDTHTTLAAVSRT